MRFGKRLKKVLSLVEENAGVVVDVGTDHGILAFKILTEKKVKKVIATDISAPSLQKAKELKQKYSLGNEFLCLVGDGLHPVQDEEKIDLVIIAGMGGHEIVKILEETKDFGRLRSFIFQPMQDTEVLREYLLKNGWQIDEDETVKDRNKFYSTIKCCPSKSSAVYKEEEVFVGKSDAIRRGADFLEWVGEEISALQKRKGYLTPKQQQKLEILKSIQLENEEKKK